MRVRVLCFGSIREMVGCAALTLEIAEGASVGDAWAEMVRRHAGLARFQGSVAMALNQSFAASTDPLHEGDEVALLPPVSGGLAAPDELPLCTAHARLQREPIVADVAAADFRHPENGALVVFDGVARNNTRGRRTLYLEYEAYPQMAVAEMERLATEALARFAVRDARLVHRVGRLEIGESSVLIAVASAHRAAAFEACRWLIDTLKKKVPIWKKEFFEDGAIWADGEPFPPEVLK